jgi:predicted dehydrogenase
LFLGNVPRRVQALAVFHPRHQVDMALHGVLEYDDGRFAVISCGFDSGLRNRVQLSGTAGTLTLEQAFVTWQVPPVIVVQQEDRRQEFRFPPVNPYVLEIADLVGAIRNGRPPALPPDEGLLNARILDALLACARRR